MIPLLKINQPEAISSGLWSDPPKNQPALWKEGENVLFSDGIIEKSKGYSIERELAATVTDLATAYADGIARVYAGVGPKVFKQDNGAQSEIGSGFSVNGRWVLEPYGTFLLATNNVDPPQLWKNTGVLADWPTCPLSRARLVKKIQIFPVLFSGQRVVWPSYNNIEDFVPGPGKRAGEYFIRDLDGDVMAVEPMGDMLVYYAQDMFGFMRFVGGEAAMSFQTVQGGGIGAVGPHAVVACGPFHIGMSRKGIWQSDGSQFNYILRPAMARWFESKIDWTRAEEVVGVHHESEQQVAMFFPCKDGNVRGLGYTYGGPSIGKWTVLKMPVTASGDQGVFEAPLLGVGPAWGFYNVGNNAGPNALVASLKSAPLDMGSSDRLKRWQMVEVHFDVNGVLEFRVGYSDAHDATPEWIGWETLQQENWLEDRESVFITLEFRSVGFGSSWNISGLEIYGEAVGNRR